MYHFDCVNQGKISMEDIQIIARDLGEIFTVEEIREMVQHADENGIYL
jgi:Ca2+-binding EF-hand superfamily protein